jgi:hypothetical protein
MVLDSLDYVRGVDAFMNSFSGASAYAIRKGFQSIGAEDNTAVIFSELMDSNSLFLTANADTIYTLAVLDLSKGPLVVEVPPKSLGTLNDMWFGWIIDIGAPGPDRGQGGKYLILPPDYDGPLPDNGFFVGRSKTTHALYGVMSRDPSQRACPAVCNPSPANLQATYGHPSSRFSAEGRWFGAIRLGRAFFHVTRKMAAGPQHVGDF